ncbi:MAG: transcriptional repressor LexA [Dehalococcoidales bacterium]|jgi:repressor LexA
MPVSRKRQRILGFISDFLNDRGYAPTVRDIVRGCDISTSSVVQYHLDILEREGHIQRDPQVFRSIRLSQVGMAPTRNVPLMGTIAAGKPLPVPGSDSWQTEPESMLAVAESIVRGRGNVYALKVKGTSMIDALIDDGDVVIMQQTAAVADGDMVAVWLKTQQEMTLKRVYRDAGRIRLQPANRQMSPFYQNPDNVEIQGRVIGVIRDVG